MVSIKELEQNLKNELGISPTERIPEYNIGQALPLTLTVINPFQNTPEQYNHHWAFFRIIEKKKTEKMLLAIFPDLSDWFDINAIGTIPEKAVAVMVTDNDNNIIGFSHVRQENRINGPEGKEKWVFSILGVDPKHQGKGIGNLIIDKLKEGIIKEDGKYLFARTDQTRQDTIRFYLHHGFQHDGVINHYYYGPAPAVWLWCDLTKK